MAGNSRRHFLKLAGLIGAATAAPASIQRALAQPARRVTGTIADVKHVVILMQENRSFDHYFGTMKGVRGFGDRHVAPSPAGGTIWEQSNGDRIVPPFHLDTETTNAMKVPGTPHSFDDAQAAWNQGSFGFWPKFKTDYAMGYYRRHDVPFQFALAESFTICDAYHCSITTGTDPNRIVFWSGSNFDPEERARGVNCRDDKSEPNNLRCWITGALPEPGYTYQGNALTWPTIPEVLEAAGIDWRIYQDPNNNWTGAMHGGLAFKGFREAKPGEPLYERGMREWSLEQLEKDVLEGTLPAVSWVLPSKEWSEHPSASTPIEGAEFTARVLDALTANPDVWASTVFFQTFDENDGLFDHLAPPAPPSFSRDGAMAGKATFDLAGEYFDDHENAYTSPEDTATGSTRPWGLGPRVPLYVVSPWSKGGWVNSQTFDHTSVGQFLEKRFGVVIPAISPWRRAMCGDLTSCFDFSLEGDADFPQLPEAAGSQHALAIHLQRPQIQPPEAAVGLYQEQGLRPSRALPYVLHVDAWTEADSDVVTLHFTNEGTAGATFHVYDRRHLDRLPRRYAVEAGKQIEDGWSFAQDGGIDLLVISHNGFMRSFKAEIGRRLPRLVARYDEDAVALMIENPASEAIDLTIGQDAYGANPEQTMSVASQRRMEAVWSAEQSQGWYDLTVTTDGAVLALAGRIETGEDGVSDPLMHIGA